VVMSPKSLLRHPAAVSPIGELSGGRFEPLLGDPAAPDPALVERLVLCTGKLYYDLAAARGARALVQVALVRIEELYPLPAAQIEAELARYPRAAEVVWAQEEPVNMGAAGYLERRLVPVLPRGRTLSVVARPASASPAVGSHTRHDLEQDQLVREALDGPSRPAVDARPSGEKT
jgi:2-oxoglutarate dehydrogenase E1 component